MRRIGLDVLPTHVDRTQDRRSAASLVWPTLPAHYCVRLLRLVVTLWSLAHPVVL